MNKVKWEEILKDLLLLKGNDDNLIENKETYKEWESLLMYMTEAMLDIRWCKNHNCICHPETAIKMLLQNKELQSFIEKYSYRGTTTDEILGLCENYPIITVYDEVEH